MNIKRTIITTLVALTLVAVVAPVVASATTVSDLQAQINALMAQLNTLQGTTGTTPVPTGSVVCAGITFTRNLTVGSIGQDVKCMQILLNTNGYTLAATGAGSPGMETTYFGTRTLAGVKAWQKAMGWAPANQVGPLSRAKLNSWLTGTVVVLPGNGLVPGCTSTVGFSQTTGASCATGVVAVNNGPVAAQLASDNPASGAIISNQATADLLHINFTGSGTVTSVTLQRTGISDQNTLQNVYLFDGNQRITDGYSFNVNGQLVMNGLNIAVNGSHTISVRADVESNATLTSSSVAVALVGLNGGTANVQGNTMSIVTGSAASVYLTSTNSRCVTSTNNSLNTCGNAALTSVNAGTTQYDFWSAPIQVNTRAVLLKTANFRIIGSAPTTALANIYLYVDGVSTGKTGVIGNINGTSYVMFDITSAPITLTTGSHTIDVKADIASGTSRTLQLSLQQASDLTITDPQVGVNIALAASSVNSYTANPGIYVTIAAGSSTVMIDPTFTSQTNISGGATNAVIGRFTLQGYGENVKVTDLYVSPAVVGGAATNCTTDATTGLATGANSTCGLNNVTLYFNGSQIGGQKNYTEATAISAHSNNTGLVSATGGTWGTGLDFTLGSQLIIPAGQTSTVEVRADLQTAGNYAYTAGTVRVALVGETNNATGQSSQTTLGVPQGGSVATSGLSISSSTVVAGTNPQLLASSVSPNSSTQRIGSYVIQNQSTSESVNLTSLNVGLISNTSSSVDGATDATKGQLNGGAGTAVALTNYASLTLKFSDSTPQQVNSGSLSASNSFSISDILAPNASVTVDVYANVGGTTGNVQTTLSVQSTGTVDHLAATYPNPLTALPTVIAGQIMAIGTGTISTATTALSSQSQTTPQQYIVPQGQTTPAAQATFEFASTTGGSSVINELDFLAPATVTCIQVGTLPCVTPVGGTAKVTGLTINVPAGGTYDQVVNIAYGPIGNNGGNVSNTAANIGLSYVKYTSGGAAVTPLTLGSGLPATTGAVSPSVYLVASQPTIVVDGTASNLNFSGTTAQKIGDVVIKADSHGNIKVDKMTFNVGYSGFDSASASIGGDGTNSASGMFLVAGSSGSTPNTNLSCAQAPISGTTGGTITCTDGGVYTNGYQITNVGTAQQEFSLYAVVRGTDTSVAGLNPSVTTSLKQDTTASTASVTGTTYFQWDDTSMSGSNGGVTTYGSTYSNGTGLNSYNIFNFPSNSSYTITNH